MSGVRRLEHVALQVTDVDAAVAFYKNVLGFVEFEQDGNRVYLGCGMDTNVDLAVVEGGTGVDYFAIRAGEKPLEDYVTQVEEADVSVEWIDREVPGQERGIRFDLPSGRLSMAVVEVTDNRYHNPADLETLPTSAAVDPNRSPHTPVDLSHITAMSPDVQADVTFLRDVVDLRISDIGQNPDGDWIMTFLRSGDYHHDVALFDDPDHSLHHLAWEVTDVGQLIRLMDHIVANGKKFEVGPVRHGPGSNIAAYFQEPGGNRFELCTEEATVNPEAEVEYYDIETMPFSGWSDSEPPESFQQGS